MIFIFGRKTLHNALFDHHSIESSSTHFIITWYHIFASFLNSTISWVNSGIYIKWRPPASPLLRHLKDFLLLLLLSIFAHQSSKYRNWTSKKGSNLWLLQKASEKFHSFLSRSYFWFFLNIHEKLKRSLKCLSCFRIVSWNTCSAVKMEIFVYQK